jgi:hypothetical protein
MVKNDILMVLQRHFDGIKRLKKICRISLKRRYNYRVVLIMWCLKNG